MGEALKLDTGQAGALHSLLDCNSSVRNLLSGLLSYIERHSAYSSPIQAYLFTASDDNLLTLYDTCNVDAEFSSRCNVVHKGDCHCGSALASASPSVVNYSPESDIKRCEGMCPRSHLAVPVMHKGVTVGLLNVSLPNTDSGQAYDDHDYPEIFDLVSGYLGAAIDTWASHDGKPGQNNSEDKRFQVLLESAPDAIIVADTKGRIITVNRHCRDLLGYGPDELMGQPVETLLPDELRESHGSMRREYAGNPHNRLMTEKSDLYARHKNGSLIPVEIALSPLVQDGDSSVIAIIRDVTHRKEYEKELRHRAFVTEHSPNPIIEIDRSGKVIYANHKASLLSLDNVSTPCIKTLSENLWNITDTSQSLDMLTQEVIVGERVFQQKVRHNDETDSYFVYYWDISESRELSNKMSIRSQTDSLTGLSTQVAFVAALQDAINQANLAGVTHTVLFISLDETLLSGPDPGLDSREQVFQKTARLLMDNTRISDTVARMDGGQFAVLLGCCPVRKGYQVAEKIKASLDVLVYPRTQAVKGALVSIGVIEVSKSLDSYHDVLESVRKACQKAGEDGANMIYLHRKTGELRR